MVVQVHFLLPRSMDHMKPVHHAATPPFLLLLCFPMESPAGGEQTRSLQKIHGTKAGHMEGLSALGRQ